MTRTDGEVRRVRSDHGVESVIDVSEVLIDAGAECKQRTPKPALVCGRVWRFRLTDRRSELVSDDVIVCVIALLQRHEEPDKQRTDENGVGTFIVSRCRLALGEAPLNN